MAAYCRVSTDQEEQLGSFENQVQYYTKYINENPAYQMASSSVPAIYTCAVSVVVIAVFLKIVPFEDVIVIVMASAPAGPVSPVSPCIDHEGTLHYRRNPMLTILAKKANQYTCVFKNIDIITSDHSTFECENGTLYVECHHLIPLKYFQDFDHSLDCPANILTLCPTCHRALHSGSKLVKKQLLEKAYEIRHDMLKAAGIDITLEDLLNLYNV